MFAPAHIGIEHPSLFWLFGVGLFAFIAGLLVNMSRSGEEGSTHTEAVGSEEDVE